MFFLTKKSIYYIIHNNKITNFVIIRKYKEFMMKIVFIGLIVLIGYAIATDNMGGARDAASNYNKILTQAKR